MLITLYSNNNNNSNELTCGTEHATSVIGKQELLLIRYLCKQY